MSLAVEEGHDGVGGGPELEGEPLVWELEDDDAGVKKVTRRGPRESLQS